MKISYNWLKEYVEIDDSPKNLADKLTMAGIEVEDIVEFSIPKSVVVVEIIERSKHPNADKLSICKVSDGLAQYSVVCGAQNCDVGKKVPFAKIGTILKDKQSGEEFKIEKREIRKIPSDGMLCSAKELGLEDKSDGLLELPLSSILGESLSKLYPDDVVFDLEITPNRPDLLSHIGIARQIAAIYNTKFIQPKIAKFANPSGNFANLVSVLAPELCPRYTARIVSGVKVAESPSWLKDKLRKVGLRPINNIVDITNFVLFESGQPLHAFDLTLLKGGKIVVRRAKKGEKIMTLDGQEHKLDEDNLVICDEEKPVALAGIMGGENSGINAQTTDILIESAYFLPANIRASSRRLSISSDSSYRFERGVDFENVAVASDRALSLILELAGGEVVSPLIDVCAKREPPVQIHCRFERIRNLLGLEISSSEILDIFKRLQMNIHSSDEKSCIVSSPSWRSDINCEADLAEEVLCVHGIAEVPEIPVKVSSGGLISEDAYLPVERFRNNLVSLGLFECMNYSFFDKKTAMLDVRFKEEDLVAISNPLSHDSEFMRPSLFAGMLNTVERNVSRASHDLSLFEIGNVFRKKNGVIEERIEAIVALTGRKAPERFSEEKKATFDFYDIKGLFESIMEICRIEKWSFKNLSEETAEARLFTTECLALNCGENQIAVLGKVSENFLADSRIKYPLYIGIIDLQALLKAEQRSSQFKPFSQFPSIRRDIALEADCSLRHAQIVDFVNKQKVPYLESFELFDVFEDPKLGDGKRSLAYSFYYRSMERTLTDEEVNKIHDELRAKFAKSLPVQLR